MMGALRELQMAQDTGLPEMLALIEDDLTGLSQVERQLLRNTDMELTDNNVVDYLLDVEQDPVAGAAPADNNNHRRQQNRQRQYHPSAKARPGRPQEASELNVRRKKWCSGQKRMTDEEDLAVRRQRSTREARARARREDRSPADNKREDDSPDDRHTRSKEDDRSPVHNKKGDDSPKHSDSLEHKLVRSKAEEDWSTTDNKKEDGSPEDDHTLAKEGEQSPAADNFREDASPQDKLTRTEGKDATPKETHKKSRKEDGEYRNTLQRASRERSPPLASDAPEQTLSPRDTRRRTSGEDGPSADRHRRDGGQTTDTRRKRVATSEARRQAKEKDESDVNRQRRYTRVDEEPVDTCLRVGNRKDNPHVDTNTRGNRKARSSLGDTVSNEDDAASVCTRRRSGRKNASVLAENCKGDGKETSNRILRTNKRRCSSMNERVLVVRRSKRRRRQSTQYVISW
ncbi:micronuclear linker histone polyprotein-like isoform X2 [Littorina saxatilis]